VSRALVVDLGGARRCLSSAVLGGGLHIATHWLNVQVPHDYSRLDPEAHLAGEALARGLRPESVVGMLTAADVDAVQLRARGPARVRATVGIGHPLAAAATAVGGAVAATVHGAVLAGARADELRTARSRRGGAARSRRAGAARWRRAGAAT